ncbi:hypothetical protein AB4305_33940 [Nocardia sp. 2YAB30]|uniref:hypothetical protein n=1 Tax=Nocardia sp. 2YAB30 TaxID=3233022 RepID=UPI003F97BBBA
MPDEYDDFRRRLSNYEKGLYFELGRAREQGETPERGWVQQFAIKIDDKTRRLDSARTEGRGTRGVERKSGRINEQETLRQLSLERLGLESGQLAHSRWETVSGEKIPPAVAAELQAMARDLGDKFQHVIISRADALRAIQLGQSLVSQQLELIRPYELNRANRARERLAKIREIVRAQERAEKFRKMQQFREAAARGRADAPQQVERDRQARAEAERTRQACQTQETERALVEREAAERVAREFSPPNEMWRGREAVEVGERAAREVADSASVVREAADKARGAVGKERDARETAEKERADELSRIQRQGVPSEVVRLLGLGQAQPPSAAVQRAPDDDAPRVERGGSYGQDRRREMGRDR